MPEENRLQLLPGTLEMLVLQSLVFGPRHGHGIATTIQRTSDELLLVDHGSLYPALQLLEDQGLVRSTEEQGRRRFELTEEGRALQARSTPGTALWDDIVSAADDGALALRSALRGVELAVSQVAEAGTPEQKTRAEALLADLRRQLYLLLADGPTT